MCKDLSRQIQGNYLSIVSATNKFERDLLQVTDNEVINAKIQIDSVEAVSIFRVFTSERHKMQSKWFDVMKSISWLAYLFVLIMITRFKL